MESSLVLFVSTILVISLIPGLNVLLIVSQSLNGGVKSSLLSIGGIVAGNVLYLLLSVAGIGIVLSNFPAGLQVMKAGGVAFTLYSAFTLIRAGVTKNAGSTEIQFGNGRNFLQGFLTIISNPKAFIFWMTVLPGFVKASSGKFLWQVALLGILAITIDTTVLFVYSSLASVVRTSGDRSKKVQFLVSGVILVGVAVWLAVS
ncbi:MAG TPA: LysE family translocator [Chryseosolibacter sp.]|nr:LysE family translocator [Chryseosolibacter sp.]